MQQAMKNARKLFSDANRTLRASDNPRPLKGVHVTSSDLEEVMLYTERYVQAEGKGFPGLMHPRGTTAELFQKYNITIPPRDQFTRY